MIVNDLERIVAGREIIRSLRRATRVEDNLGKLDRLESIFDDVLVIYRRRSRMHSREFSEIMLACAFLLSILRDMV